MRGLSVCHQAKLYDDSPFKLVPVRQHLAMLKESNFKMTDKYKAFLKENRARPLLSQIVEDGFCSASKDQRRGLGQD